MVTLTGPGEATTVTSKAEYLCLKCKRYFAGPYAPMALCPFCGSLRIARYVDGEAWRESNE